MAAAQETGRSGDDVAAPAPGPQPVPWPEVCRCADPEPLSFIFRIWHRQPLADLEEQQ
jgi:hypothetical protein